MLTIRQRRKAEGTHACFLDSVPLSLPQLIIKGDLRGFRRYKLADVIRYVLRKNYWFHSPDVIARYKFQVLWWFLEAHQKSGWDTCKGSS